MIAGGVLKIIILMKGEKRWKMQSHSKRWILEKHKPMIAINQDLENTVSISLCAENWIVNNQMITPGEQNRVPASILTNQVEQGYGSVLLLGTALILSNFCPVLKSRRAWWMTKQTRYPTEMPLSLSLFLARSSS